MRDINEPMFTRATLEAAMATNCSYYHGMSVNDRFCFETPILLDALDGYLKRSSRVMDYGIGVGRVTKELLDRYPNLSVVGVDNSNNMLQYAREYIPESYFNEARVQLLLPDKLSSLQTGSIDFIFGVYVLQHVSAEMLPTVFNEFERTMADDGKLYVLNCHRRAVPRQERLELYLALRMLFRVFEHNSAHKQIQRLSTKLDNKCLLHNDGINLSHQLAGYFTPLQDVPLNGSSHMQQIMKNHFSRLYSKRNKQNSEVRF